MRTPLAGGAPQEILTADEISGFSCSRTTGACLLTEGWQKARISYLLDPLKGRGRKLLETDPDAGRPAISPDGHHLAFVLSATPHDRIRIINLHGTTMREITVSGAQYLGSLDWSADGTGFFSVDMQQTTTRLLHVERSGASQVLWTLPFR
jgi:hypothetical protein